MRVECTCLPWACAPPGRRRRAVVRSRVMEIGKPLKKIVVEPIRDPVPERAPKPAPEPAPDRPEPARTRP
jgi:hypothetical protein